MNTPINDGGPAFPNNDSHGCAYAGMTLRDYFAGQTLIGISAALHDGIRPKDLPPLAADCYAIADAMIAAREVKP
jgi:hypothetical protein